MYDMFKCIFEIKKKEEKKDDKRNKSKGKGRRVKTKKSR